MKSLAADAISLLSKHLKPLETNRRCEEVGKGCFVWEGEECNTAITCNSYNQWAHKKHIERNDKQLAKIPKLNNNNKNII
jgi:hypothetical protein